MEPIALIQALRESTRPLSDEGETDFWVKELRPLLPVEPLTDAFLDEVMAPVEPGILRIHILDLLARLKRREISNYAARMADEETDSGRRSRLAGILMRCGDVRGYQEIEKLYDEAEHESDLKRRESRYLHISKAMEELEPGDSRAREISRRRSVPRLNERMLTHSKYAHRVGNFVFDVAIMNGDVVCLPADMSGYDNLAAAFWLMWLDPAKFMTVFENRSKWKRGPNALVFSEASRGKIPAGKVQASFDGKGKMYDRALVEEAGCVFAATAVEVLKEAGRPVPDGIEARLKAVRARI